MLTALGFRWDWDRTARVEVEIERRFQRVRCHLQGVLDAIALRVGFRNIRESDHQKLTIRREFNGICQHISSYLRPKSFLIFATSPVPISLLLCIGMTENRLFSSTFRCDPLPLVKVAPCFSNQRLNSLLFMYSM